MKATLSRWGNSTAVRIPKALLEAVGMKEGDAVRVEADGNGLRLSAATTQASAFFEAMRAARDAGLEMAPLWDDPPRGSEIL